MTNTDPPVCVSTSEGRFIINVQDVEYEALCWNQIALWLRELDQIRPAA
jgi:hypothetical protein